jgi:hypothetical protein
LEEQIKLNFATIEKALWNATLETFQRSLVEILSILDRYLMAKRNKERYEYKERKEKTLITMLGEVTIKRRYYWDTEQKEWVFLLDELLGIESTAVSDSLKELVVIWATKGPSYRDVLDRLHDLFNNQILSHEKIRQLLIETSELLQKQGVPEEKKKKVRILFIEADGFWTGVQKKGFKTKKKRETKLIVVHEGWEKRQADDYKLKNPIYLTSYRSEKAADFWDRVYLRIWSKYEDLGSIPIIINGDFASWIRGGLDCFKNGFYQYDRFHLKRDIKRLLSKNQDNCKAALLAIDENVPEKLLELLDEEHTLTKDEDIFEFIMRLKPHQEAVIDYRERLAEKKYQLPEDLRGMGAAESNVDRFKLRTSKRGRAWSARGLEAILKMLGMLYEGTLKEAIAGLDSTIFTTEQTEELVAMSAGQVAKQVGVKALNAQKAGFPSLDKGVSQGYSKLFRQMLEVQMV